MKIYTSYFSKAKTLAENGIMIIGIAQYPPRWFYGFSMKKLAPSPSILHEESWDVYKRRFDAEIIGKLDPHQILREIAAISQGRDVALCCFEKDRNGCHRKIVAEWLTQNTGVAIEEYEERPTVVQQSLF